MKSGSLMLACALLACSSSGNEAPPKATDSAPADTSVAETAVDSAPVDSTPTDTSEAATCTLSGNCFDDFIPRHKKAATCFGHFDGPCGKFSDSSRTMCKWDDGASFEVVAEDGGLFTVIYKGATGTECFRRLGSGDLVFPDGATYTSAVKTAADPSDNTLTIGCKTGTAFTCKLGQCIDCGIDVRVCCS